MDAHSYSELTDMAWRASLQEHEARVPERLSDAQAQQQFARLARTALLVLAKAYANHLREQDGQAPLRRVAIPDETARWLDSKIALVDDLTGHLGSESYRHIANGFLAQLRNLEQVFLGARER